MRIKQNGQRIVAHTPPASGTQQAKLTLARLASCAGPTRTTVLRSDAEQARVTYKRRRMATPT